MSIPPLPRTMRIQNADGTVSSDFARWWQLNVVATDAVGAQAQAAASSATAAQSQAQTASAAASSAGAGLSSGSAVGQLFDCTSASRVTVASVDLVGVTAGTLRFDTTSLYAIYPTTQIDSGVGFQGTFWITEQLTSGVGPQNDLYTDVWTGETGIPPNVYIEIPDQAALDAARPAVGITGAVRYRLQVARSFGTNQITSAYADLRAAQAS
jgi:hypothetical protein